MNEYCNERVQLFWANIAIFDLSCKFKVVRTWLNNTVPVMFPLLETVLELTFWIVFKISQTVLFGIPRSFSSSRTINRRSLSITSRICSILPNVFVVEGRPERELLSTEVRPALKRLYYSFIRVLLINSFPKAFCITWIVSELVFPSWKQNLTQIRWSCFSVIFNNHKICRTQK